MPTGPRRLVVPDGVETGPQSGTHGLSMGHTWLMPKGSTLYRGQQKQFDSLHISEDGESGPGVYTSHDKNAAQKYVDMKQDYAPSHLLTLTTSRALRLLDRRSKSGETEFRGLQRDPDTFDRLNGDALIQRFRNTGYDGVIYDGASRSEPEIVLHRLDDVT